MIHWQKTSNAVRIGLISNADTTGKGSQWLARAVQAALQTQSRNHAKLFVQKLIKEENYLSMDRGDTKVQDYEVNVSPSMNTNWGMKLLRFLKLV